MRKLFGALLVLVSVSVPLCGASWLFFPTAAVAWLPTTAPDLKLWLDAQSSDAENMTLVSGDVSVLKDKSGNGYDFAQGSAGSRPTYAANTRNGLGTITCDRSASDTVYRNSTTIVNPAAPHTVVAVFKVDSYGSPARAAAVTLGSTLDGYFLIHSVGNTFMGNNGEWNYGAKVSTPVADFDWNYWTWTYNGSGASTLGNYTMYLDGSAQTIASGDVSGWGGTGVVSAICGYGNFADPDNFMTGNFAELVVYSRVLSAGELSSLHGYIASKWGF